MRNSWLDWAIVFALASIVLGIMVVLAYSHDAPMGWSYDFTCCAGIDCEQVATKVDTTPIGYLIEETGETVPYGDKRLKQSHDEYYHRCHFTTDFKKTRCLYTPEQAF